MHAPLSIKKISTHEIGVGKENFTKDTISKWHLLHASLFGNEVSIFEFVINCPCDDLIYWFTYYI